MTSKPMIRPVLRDDDFLEDILQARLDTGRLHLWWLGQSGFLLEWEGRHLLFDPYLSDSLTRKYAGTDKPHQRLTEIIIAPERLTFIDVVTSSHNHTDHLDRDTLEPLRRVNSGLRLVIPEANRDFVTTKLEWRRDKLEGLDAGQSLTIAGFRIQAVPAAHNDLESDSRGRHKFLGYVVQAGPWTVYHSGDTVHYEGMERILRSWRIDLALLPINGNRPERKVAGNLDGREAASLAKTVGARLVIPCHFDMFAFNTVSPEEFERACREMAQPFRTLRCGERWSSRELEDLSSPPCHEH